MNLQARAPNLREGDRNAKVVTDNRDYYALFSGQNNAEAGQHNAGIGCPDQRY